MENRTVILNKYESIERCINRINEEYEGNANNLNNYSKADAIVLNLQRACELVIDIAMYIISTQKLGIPQTKKEAFEILLKNNYITDETYKKMRGMIGFRNIAVHSYQTINWETVFQIITTELEDFKQFVKEIMKLI